MEVEKIFGERIRKLRTQNKLTQKQLGEVIGLTHKSISTIESGICATTLEKLVAFCKNLCYADDRKEKSFSAAIYGRR